MYAKKTITFDARVLQHCNYTGVENYTHAIMKQLSRSLHVRVCGPMFSNKYFAHIWTHFALPFISTDTLFCPANIAPFWFSAHKRLVVTIHDVAFMTHPQSFSWIFGWYYRLVIPRAISRADAIITVSQFSRSEIERFYPKAVGKIHVIALGVDNRFRSLDIPREKMILYVGSMNERKNFTAAIKAFLALHVDDYHFVMVGNFHDNFALTDESKAILSEAKSNPKIRFLPNVSNDELVVLYNQASCFVYPSLYEGFGLPPLEAMACGTPVVVSRAASLPEVCGEAALYCNPHDPADIAHQIQCLLTDKHLWQTMRQAGLIQARKYTWEASAKAHVEVLLGDPSFHSG